MILSDFKTLQEAQSHTQIAEYVFNSNEITMLLLRCELYSYFADNNNDVHRAFFDRVKADSRFDFTTSENGQANLYLLDVIIASEASNSALQSKLSALKTLCINQAQEINYPFTNVTQAQFNIAKGLFVSKQFDYIAGNSVVLTLNNNLTERVAATVWLIENGFDDENAGRNVYIKAAQKYRIDMRGKKTGKYEIRIPLLDADFDVVSV